MNFIKNMLKIIKLKKIININQFYRYINNINILLTLKYIKNYNY